MTYFEEYKLHHNIGEKVRYDYVSAVLDSCPRDCDTSGYCEHEELSCRQCWNREVKNDRTTIN